MSICSVLEHFQIWLFFGNFPFLHHLLTTVTTKTIQQIFFFNFIFGRNFPSENYLNSLVFGKPDLVN